MARIFDVVEHPSEMVGEIVRRYPESGSGDFRIGSQVIVRESQNAVFFRDGRALDTFKPGRHTITTANIPLIMDFIGRTFFNSGNPFPAEVYYVSMRDFANEKWGTPQPILVKNPGVGLGIALVQAFGTYSFAVADAQQFVNQVVGQMGAMTTAGIQDRLRSMMVSKLQDILGEMGTKQGKSVLDLVGLTEEIGAAVRAKAAEDFRAIGLVLKSFFIESIKPSTKSIEELRSMGLLDMQTYMQLQAADAMRDAAQNQSGGAGLTAGIGAGMGIGQIMGQTLQQGMSQPAQQVPANSAGAGAAASAMPDVMTPAQAASYLQVSESDILAMVEAGELKAKRIGSQIRISKQVLDEFLKS